MEDRTPGPGMTAATARLVAYADPLRTVDGQRRRALLLVVDCPFCDGQHVHPAGDAGAVGTPRLCPRRSRCVGRPAGTYYFPAVHQ
jgi:hypothetical protein